MKKFAAFALACILVFALVACGRKNDTVDQTPTDDTPTTDTTPTTPDDGTNIPDPSVNDNSTDDDNSGIADDIEEMIPGTEEDNSKTR